MHIHNCIPPSSESASSVTNHNIILKFIRPVFISIFRPAFTMDLKPNSGLVVAKWEHILGGTPVHCRAMCTHTCRAKSNLLLLINTTQTVNQPLDQTRDPGTVRWQCLSVGQVCATIKFMTSLSAYGSHGRDGH